jgi:hypothetical protein
VILEIKNLQDQFFFVGHVIPSKIGLKRFRKILVNQFTALIEAGNAVIKCRAIFVRGYGDII